MGFCIPVFEALAVIFWGLILVLIIFWIFVLILCLNPVKHDSWNNKKIYITLACPVFFYILFCVSFLLFVTTSCFALIVCCCLSCLTFSLLLSWLSSTMPAFLPDSHSVLLSVCVCVCIMLSFPLVQVFISVHLWSICVLPMVLDTLHYLVCGFGFLVFFFFFFCFLFFVFLHSELNSFYCIFESTNINSLTLWDLCHH